MLKKWMKDGLMGEYWDTPSLLSFFVLRSSLHNIEVFTKSNNVSHWFLRTRSQHFTFTIARYSQKKEVQKSRCLCIYFFLHNPNPLFPFYFRFEVAFCLLVLLHFRLKLIRRIFKYLTIATNLLSLILSLASISCMLIYYLLY